jgi:hydrogenase maturation protein HypF
MKQRWRVHISGIVQGVGFRPFLFALAEKHGLVGSARNDGHGVALDIEGDAVALKDFLIECRSAAPPLAAIETITCENAGAPRGLNAFSIAASLDHEQYKFTLLAPDVSVCDDCLRELFDPRDRRFHYPFINCTNCGPRFTIIQDVPYDRARTTMSAFLMCPDCAREYDDPRNRRFHAQPNACAVCGPRLSLLGEETTGSDEVIMRTVEYLRRGEIIAIKGIGGYHLACDALNNDAVRKLRERKLREDKPFALMADSLMTLREYCAVSEIEEALLLSPARPIVLLKKLPTANEAISPVVAPQQKQLGFMLPYTPPHHLLLARCAGPLVMTSGNVSDEPIAYQDEEAITRLREIADHFLISDRRIHMRCDDSVVCIRRGQPLLLRRARGYVPLPLSLTRSFARQILACGAELKNTFCLTRDQYAFVSHHIGDLENLETLRSFEEGIAHFERLFYLQPEAVAHDLHPEYLSTKYALALNDELTKVGVQHHHAHIISCLADNNALADEEPLLGVAFDGLGYGTDGRLWGGEFLLATPMQFERVAHLQYQPMPGGAGAIREPWRMASVFLQDAWGDEFTALDLPFAQKLNQAEWHVMRQMISRGINAPLTSSMGRLFDAVAALLGLRDVARYEAQAAIELEMIVDESYDGNGYEFTIANNEIQSAPLIRGIVSDLLDQVAPPIIAAKFHCAVAHLIRVVADQIRILHHVRRIVLSGGVFQNRILLERAVALLTADGFEVLTHSRVPPNDGGLSLGQAVIADALLKAGKV